MNIHRGSDDRRRSHVPHQFYSLAGFDGSFVDPSVHRSSDGDEPGMRAIDDFYRIPYPSEATPLSAIPYSRDGRHLPNLTDPMTLGFSGEGPQSNFLYSATAVCSPEEGSQLGFSYPATAAGFSWEEPQYNLPYPTAALGLSGGGSQSSFPCPATDLSSSGEGPQLSFSYPTMDLSFSEGDSQSSFGSPHGAYYGASSGESIATLDGAENYALDHAGGAPKFPGRLKPQLSPIRLLAEIEHTGSAAYAPPPAPEPIVPIGNVDYPHHRAP
ncbi:MAG: hypothetical protein M1839_008268 [Geoglossum umbratile]|nr:MAG: hypothetical protein M1839_008268 [Geoglossum umbratile]